MHPPLRVNDVCNGITHTANKMAKIINLADKRVDFGLIRKQEFDIIAAGKA
jgi:hypothetical protein